MSIFPLSNNKKIDRDYTVEFFNKHTRELLKRLHVYCTEFFRILRIGLSFIRNLLAFLQPSVPLSYNRREMYEHVVATFVAGDESVALFRVEPLHSTLTHSRYPLSFCYRQRTPRLILYYNILFS